MLKNPILCLCDGRQLLKLVKYGIIVLRHSASYDAKRRDRMNMRFTERCEDDEVMQVEYMVIPGEKYGIAGKYSYKNECGVEKTRGLFFTEGEAIEWCHFMVENRVLPSAINQIMRDELYIEILPGI